jgi:hypothetical protein
VRYARVLAVLGLVAAVGVGVFIAARASRDHTVKPTRVGAAISPTLRRMARQEAQELVAARSRSVPPKLARVIPLTPSGQTCFVAAGTCSETPCVIPVGSGSNAPLTALPATATIPRPHTAITVGPGVGTVVIPNRPPLLPGRACPGKPAGPQSLRVSTG